MQARTKRELAALQRYRQTVLILAHKRSLRAPTDDPVGPRVAMLPWLD